MAGSGTTLINADEFQFVIRSISSELRAFGLSADGSVAFNPDSGFVAVRTGSHWGPVQCGYAVRDERASDPAEEWEDVIEFSVETPDGLAVDELFGGRETIIVHRRGVYRVRVSAKDRDEGASLGYDEMTSMEPSSQAPVEQYLIEVWPGRSAPPQVVRLASRSAVAGSSHEDHVAVAEPELDGVAEAVRVIGSEVDRHADSGIRLFRTGTAHAFYDYEASADVLFSSFAHLFGWFLCGAGGRAAAVGEEFFMDCGSPEDHPRHAITGMCRSELRCRWIEVEEPTSVSFAWSWDIRPRTPLLDGGTIVRIRLVQRSADPHPQTRVYVSHEGLPIDWVEPMSTFWAAQLSDGDTTYRLGRTHGV